LKEKEKEKEKDRLLVLTRSCISILEIKTIINGEKEKIRQNVSRIDIPGIIQRIM